MVMLMPVSTVAMPMGPTLMELSGAGKGAGKERVRGRERRGRRRECVRVSMVVVRVLGGLWRMVVMECAFSKGEGWSGGENYVRGREREGGGLV